MHNVDEGDYRTNQTWSTGRAMAYGYDDAYQLTSVDASRPSEAARYRYDAAGNPVDRAELGLDVTNSFNNLNQIVTGSWTGSTVTVAGSVNYPVGSISVNNTPGTVYPDSSFDVSGVPVVPGTNILVATYVGPAYTNVPMTATDTSTVVLGDTAYTHDANGNLTGDATFLYQYDLANQLTNVIRKADNAVVLQCRYDALGRRVEAIRADGTVDRYIYFPGTFLVLAVLDETNTPKEFYTRGPDLSGTLASAGGIGGLFACTYASAPTVPLYHHADLMGNIIALTDSSATLTATFRYTPFGQLVACRGTNMVRNLFASKEREAGTDLVYFGYRYLSPLTGSWLSRDPSEEGASINLHEYVGNDVFNWFDAWGAVKVIQHLERTKEKIRPDKGKPVWGWTDLPRLTDIKAPVLEYDSNMEQFKVVQKPELTFQIDIQVVKSGRQEWKEWRRDKNRHRRKMPVFVQGKLSNAAYEHELKRFSAWKEGLEAYWTQIENRTLDMTAPTCEELLQKIDDLFADAYTHWELSAEYRIARFKQVHIYNDKNYSIGIMKNGLFGPKIEYILDKK